MKTKIERIATDLESALNRYFEQEESRARLWCKPEDDIGINLQEILDDIGKRRQYAKVNMDEANEKPIHIGDSGFLLWDIKSALNIDPNLYNQSRFFLFYSCLYSAEGPCTVEEFRLLVFEKADRERKHFKRLAAMHDGEELQTCHREGIPEKVRLVVWRRDAGKCSRCGNRERLEYDHIIPVSEGGSNTARNIELLCEKCNRSKGAKIQ